MRSKTVVATQDLKNHRSNNFQSMRRTHDTHSHWRNQAKYIGCRTIGLHRWTRVINSRFPPYEAPAIYLFLAPQPRRYASLYVKAQSGSPFHQHCSHSVPGCCNDQVSDVASLLWDRLICDYRRTRSKKYWKGWEWSASLRLWSIVRR